MGIHSFILDPTLEATTKFAGDVSQGCYVCRLDNHYHTTCTYLTDWKRLVKTVYDSNNATTPKNSNITTNTRIKANINNQGNFTQHIQTKRVSNIVKDMKVEDNNILHDNNNSSIDNDNNTEVSNHTMYSLVHSSNYSSCYSNVVSSHSGYNSTLAHHDIPTHTNFRKLILLAHNKRTFTTKCSKYLHTSICKCIRIFHSTRSQTQSIPNISTSTPTTKTLTSTLISPKIIIARISKYLQSPTTIK